MTNTDQTERTVTAAVLIIGNEILSGRTQDTNLNHLATTLGSWGIQVREARTVADVLEDVVDAINALRTRYQYVFTTGGIGPTHDDITADCVAAAFGVELIESPEIAERIRGRPAPDDVMASRLRMARIPEGAGLIDNPTGGPQGFVMGNVHVMAGIPSVMKAMLSTLESALERGAIVRSCSVTAFLGESQIATALGQIQDAHPNVDLGSYPFFRDDRYGTSLVLRGTNVTELEQVREEVKAAIVLAGSEPGDISEIE